VSLKSILIQVAEVRTLIDPRNYAMLTMLMKIINYQKRNSLDLHIFYSNISGKNGKEGSSFVRNVGTFFRVLSKAQGIK
jgi:thermostable 8-oxoguanine DNA glycosylase